MNKNEIIYIDNEIVNQDEKSKNLSKKEWSGNIRENIREDYLYKESITKRQLWKRKDNIIDNINKKIKDIKDVNKWVSDISNINELLSNKKYLDEYNNNLSKKERLFELEKFENINKKILKFWKSKNNQDIIKKYFENKGIIENIKLKIKILEDENTLIRKKKEKLDTFIQSELNNRSKWKTLVKQSELVAIQKKSKEFESLLLKNNNIIKKYKNKIDKIKVEKEIPFYWEVINRYIDNITNIYNDKELSLYEKSEKIDNIDNEIKLEIWKIKRKLRLEDKIILRDSDFKDFKDEDYLSLIYNVSAKKNNIKWILNNTDFKKEITKLKWEREDIERSIKKTNLKKIQKIENKLSTLTDEEIAKLEKNNEWSYNIEVDKEKLKNVNPYIYYSSMIIYKILFYIDLISIKLVKSIEIIDKAHSFIKRNIFTILSLFVILSMIVLASSGIENINQLWNKVWINESLFLIYSNYIPSNIVINYIKITGLFVVFGTFFFTLINLLEKYYNYLDNNIEVNENDLFLSGWKMFIYVILMLFLFWL